jgi:HEAT repeat protein
MSRGDAAAKQWYPELLRLATYNVEEVRNTDAWVMGQDTAQQEFHAVLLKMLQDDSPMVRGNAALSLVRFGDPSGHDQIVSLLQPAKIAAPRAGEIEDTGKAGTAVRQGGLIAELRGQDGRRVEVRSPVTGRIRAVEVERGDRVSAGTELAIVAPGDDQVWEALRALYLIGRPEDLPSVIPYQHQIPDVSERVRQQAVQTERAIRDRK